MGLIEEIKTVEITDKFEEYSQLGGVIDFKIFKVSGTQAQQEKHHLIAEKTLELISQDIDAYFNKIVEQYGTHRDKYFKLINEPIPNNAFTQLTIEQFFGPYFDTKDKRPIVSGIKGVKADGEDFASIYRYHYNDEENFENRIIIDLSEPSEFCTYGYADAFLHPPHSFGRKMTMFETGNYFLYFNELLFDDISQLEVYAWDTKCSNYFDSGKEFWGSFFWTVYNPTKDWYIGIAASTTD